MLHNLYHGETDKKIMNRRTSTKYSMILILMIGHLIRFRFLQDTF